MRCHYEVLEVPKDADDSQIKTAYRKLALKWHPDKNLDNSEVAKEQFQLVQQAYEVLSDRQERAWYDNHREQILRGKNSEFKDNSLDVFQYFTTTCFKGYNDEEEGFYTIYRKVFEEIAREDIEYMEAKEEFCEIPTFGASTSDYDNIVGPFYAYWVGYSTKKSFVWLDLYNSNETRDRKILKLMEKENKKVRLKARKERNDEIRALVAFVRKRDKRVQEYSKKLEAKILENRLKQEELSKQKRLERKKQLNESKSQAEWTKFDNVKTALEEIEKNLAEQFGEQISDSDNESEIEELDNLYCVACNKVFKTPKAFENHELSKKHKENVEKLKGTMLEEDEEVLDESENLSDNSGSEKLNGVNSDELSDIENVDEELETKVKCKQVNNEELSDLEELDEEPEEEVETKRKKKQKKNKNVIRVSLNEHQELFLLDKQLEEKSANDVDDFNISSTSKKQKRKNKKGNSKPDKTTEKTDDGLQNGQNPEDDEEEATRKHAEKVKKNKKTKDKRDKKEVEAQIDVDTGHCCVTCKADFPSKNKLFDHLKKTGHSVYLAQNIKSLRNKKKSVKEK